MEILLDTANIEQIKKYMKLYNVVGVTTNPTIISREKAVDIFSVFFAKNAVLSFTETP